MIRIQDGGGFGSLFSFPEHTPAELLPAPGAGRPWPWPGAVAGAGSWCRWSSLIHMAGALASITTAAAAGAARSSRIPELGLQAGK